MQKVWPQMAPKFDPQLPIVCFHLSFTRYILAVDLLLCLILWAEMQVRFLLSNLTSLLHAILGNHW